MGKETDNQIEIKITEEMRIKSIDTKTYELIDIDLYGETVHFRRNSSDNWEELIGESWEPVFDVGDLEIEYQKLKTR